MNDLVWTRDLLQLESCHSETVPECLDVTGWPRLLFFGPYKRLEAGLWRLTVRLRLCADAARYPYRIEFGVDPDYTHVDFEPGGPGLTEVTHDRAWLEPADPVQMRLWILRPAFHGELRFEEARVEKIAELSPGASEQ